MLDGKKILFLIPSLEMGGSERQALRLARLLSDGYGAEPVLWGISSKGLLVGECEHSNFPCEVIDFRWPAGRLMQAVALMKLAAKIRTVGPDVLLPYTLLPNVLCGCIWQLTGARGCLWNQRDTRGYRMTPIWERRAIRKSSGFVANSRHVKEYLQTTFRIPGDKIQVVHNGIELSLPLADRATWRQRLECAPGDLLVVMVANLHRYKDHATLLSAWELFHKQLLRHERSAVLVLAGIKGETFEPLRAQAEQAGIADSVRFPGQVEDVSGLLEAADIGLFSSRTEGSPNGLLECMAAGLPVLATDIPPIREVCALTSKRVLVAPGDARGLAEKLLWLALDPEQRRALGEENRQRVRDEFSPEQMAQQMAEMMEQVIQS